MLKSFSHAFAAFAKRLEQQSAVCIAIFTTVYCVVTSGLAVRRFWYDELFTYYTSRLPDYQSIWASLREGADLNPPLLYVVTRASHALFGPTEFGTRVPALLGFLLMCFCLYVFVSRRCGRVYGLAAMVAPVITGAYEYAAEARSYGMVLGCGASAAVAYQSASQPSRRLWSVLALFLLLSTAVLTHTYAVLLLAPFCLAEASRVLRSQQWDWLVIAAVTLPSLAILIYLPMLAALGGYVLDTSVFRPSLVALVNSYTTLFGPAGWSVAAALAAVVLWLPSAGQRESTELSDGAFPLPAHETVLAAALISVPAIALIVAAFVTRVYMARYGLAAVIGFSILLCSLVCWAARRNPAAGAAILLIFGASAICRSGVWLYEAAYGTQRYLFKANAPLVLEQLPADQPIVISNGLLYLQADHYESPAVVSRLFFLTDRSSALSYTKTDVFDSGYTVMRKWFPIRAKTAPYAEFLRAHKRFLVVGSFEHVLEWLPHKLMADGVQLQYLGQYKASYGDVIVIEATPGPLESSGNPAQR